MFTARVGEPGRHGLLRCGVFNRRSKRASLPVRLERHGRHFSSTMAPLTMTLENRQDVTVERYAWLRGRRKRQTDDCESGCYECRDITLRRQSPGRADEAWRLRPDGYRSYSA